jgi:hypothetical protein
VVAAPGLEHPPAPAIYPPSSTHAQNWGTELFGALKAVGGRAYSNYAVGYNNVMVPEATKAGIPVGNTPGQGPCSTNLAACPASLPARSAVRGAAPRVQLGSAPAPQAC